MSEQINGIAEVWWGWMWPMFWQVGVVVGLVWVVDLVIRRRVWPQVRYALWLLVLLKLILPPGLTSPTSVTWRLEPLAEEAVKRQWFGEDESPAVHAEEIISATRLLDYTREAGPALTAEAPMGMKTVTDMSAGDLESAEALGTVAISSVKLCWKAYVMFVWFAGALVLTGWLMVRFRQLRRRHIGKNGENRLPRRFGELLAEAAKKLKLRRLPEVVPSRHLVSPAVFGVFRPVLLMPADEVYRLPRRELEHEHVLLHELSHIRRGDLKIHAFFMMLQIIYWFNPLLWLVRRQLQHLRELCCDATVARILREETSGYRETI
jgi:beta-lactamase regulating signal transducer with metallopeptidase domain